VMLSRLAVARRAAPAIVQSSRTSSAVTNPKPEILHIDEGPERDLVNFPRYKRPIYPGKVRLGFVPEEWFQFFYPKTGVTGPYLFGTGLFTYLYSKEIMVMDHEFFSGLALIMMAVYATKKFGPPLAKYADDEIEKIENAEMANYNNELKSLEEAIKAEELNQVQTAAQGLIYQVKKENVGLQLEAEFRKRQMQVYSEVKKRLDYHLEVINIQRRLQQKHMVDWIVSNVKKSISAQQEKDMLSKCISDLKGLAAKA